MGRSPITSSERSRSDLDDPARARPGGVPPPMSTTQIGNSKTPSKATLSGHYLGLRAPNVRISPIVITQSASS